MDRREDSEQEGMCGWCPRPAHQAPKDSRAADSQRQAGTRKQKCFPDDKGCCPAASMHIPNPLACLKSSYSFLLKQLSGTFPLL